jgi:hypothetical protein
MEDFRGQNDMSDFLDKMQLLDNGGRRSGSDRRQFSYAFHIPERRVSADRRSGTDRREVPRDEIR